jgi:spermidine/putrescine transport system ATP-binding protein
MIELRAVGKRYGRHVALEPTDLEIEDGEFFCLLGPSGCGKTTTLNLIGGFVEASCGEILIAGKRANDVPPHRRNVNTVFQSYALFPHMTVRDNVAFGPNMRKAKKAEIEERVAQALALVGLEEHGTRRPSELSGGQQQRVAVARALVNRPDVLLLDEPLGALDLKLRRRLQIELANIHREVGTTFVFVTHDQDEAMAMADRIGVMHDGRLEQVGTPEQIYRRPQSRFVADFIGESNFVEVSMREDGVVLAGDGSPLACETNGGRWTRGTLAVRPEAVRLLTEQGGGEGLTGRVVQRSFLGNHTRVTVHCEQLQVELSATVAQADAERLGDDSVVTVTWAACDATLLDTTR